MSDVRRTRGSKGRMTRTEPKWHGKPRETYTEYHPTIENSSSAKTAKSKARPIKDKPKKKRARCGDCDNCYRSAADRTGYLRVCDG